jgi:hypothetical protein
MWFYNLLVVTGKLYVEYAQIKSRAVWALWGFADSDSG